MLLDKFLGVKFLIFSYSSTLTYVLGAQKNRLNFEYTQGNKNFFIAHL